MNIFLQAIEKQIYIHIMIRLQKQIKFVSMFIINKLQ